MGAGSSLSQTASTHEELFKKTQSTRRMVDDIFTYMSQHLKVNDFMKLSNPEGCNRYVMFMASNLSMFFSKLRIAPHLGKEGVLAFRSVEGLEEPTGDAKKEKDTLCLALSYFYTRIFQIYGALALTLLDDIQYTVSNGAMIAESRSRAESKESAYTVPTPGQRPVYIEQAVEKKVREWRGGQAGGWTARLGYFDFLNSGLLVELDKEAYMKTSQYTQYGQPLTYLFKNKTDMGMFFKLKSQDTFGFGRPQVGKLDGIFTWVSGQKKVFEMIIRADPIGTDNKKVKVTIEACELFRKADASSVNIINEVRSAITSANLLDKFIIESSTTFPLITQDVPATRPQYSINGRSESVFDYFKLLFDSIITDIKTQYDSRVTTTEHSKIDALNISRFGTNYTKVKPLGHCIARALQLLNANPYGKDSAGKQFVSSICKPDFFIPRDKSSGERRGIPGVNEPITKSPGILSLALLFYDKVSNATPHVFMSNPSFEQYKRFIKTMTFLFEGKEEANELKDVSKQAFHPRSSEEESAQTKLTKDGTNEIRNKRMASMCTDDKPILIEGDTKNKVHSVVQKLFTRQIKHAAGCEKILSRLFTIIREPNLPIRMRINERLLQGGLPELEKINMEARELLINYYSECELMYLQGVEHIHREKDLKKVEEEKRVEKERLVKQAEQEALERKKGPPIPALGPAPPAAVFPIPPTAPVATPSAPATTVAPGAPIAPIMPVAPPKPVSIQQELIEQKAKKTQWATERKLGEIRRFNKEKEESVQKLVKNISKEEPGQMVGLSPDSLAAKEAFAKMAAKKAEEAAKDTAKETDKLKAVAAAKKAEAEKAAAEKAAKEAEAARVAAAKKAAKEAADKMAAAQQKRAQAQTMLKMAEEQKHLMIGNPQNGVKTRKQIADAVAAAAAAEVASKPSKPSKSKKGGYTRKILRH